MNPTFLTIDQAIALHADQIQRYGGEPNLRDRGLLESALAQAQAAFGGEYLHKYPAGMAAAYLYHVTLNHAFVDGNKRAGLACALTFLAMNGWKLRADKDVVEQLSLDVAAGLMKKEDVVAFFEQHIVPRPADAT